MARWGAYRNGTPLNASATFAHLSLDLLRLTSGSYRWTFSNGQTIDLQIGEVPLPAGALRLIGGLGAFAAVRRAKRRSPSAVL